ncbi:hypothetical protein ACLB2K_065203 [Fragaria x ananassa]
MGKYKFRLSDMIPNAWFYKLKDMSKTRKNQCSNSHPKKKNQPPPSTFASSAKPTSPAKPKHVTHHNHHCHHSRKSYYFTRELNSSTGCRASIESVWTKSDSLPEEQLWSTSSSLDSSELEFHHTDSLGFRCDRVLATETFDGMNSMTSSNEKDIIIDVDNSSEKKKLDSFSDLELPRIITKPESFNEMVCEVKKKKKENKEQQPIKSRKSSHGSENNKEHRTSSVRRVTSSTSPGVKLRTNSPRIANRKINQAQVGRRSLSSNSSSKRRSLSESFAIVKSSFDPQRDFRESMIEMIMENNIKASKDLEDLLACYLSLNADEYHELIIKVFKQIWFDFTDIQSK